jgi:hypothetical protein
MKSKANGNMYKLEGKYQYQKKKATALLRSILK